MILKKGLIALLLSVFLLPSKGKSTIFENLEWQAGFELASQVGLKVKKDFSNKYFGTGGVGYLPSFLATMNTSVAKGFGFVDSGTESVLKDTLTGSFLIDLRWGYKLARWKGVYVSGGYSFFFAGGRKTTESALDLSVLPTIPYNFLDETPKVSATFHNLAVYLGYIWKYKPNITIYSEVGLAKPIVAKANVEFSRDHLSVNQDKKEIEDHIKRVLTQKYFAPSAAVWVGYDFN